MLDGKTERLDLRIMSDTVSTPLDYVGVLTWPSRAAWAKEIGLSRLAATGVVPWAEEEGSGRTTSMPKHDVEGKCPSTSVDPSLLHVFSFSRGFVVAKNKRLRGISRQNCAVWRGKEVRALFDQIHRAQSLYSIVQRARAHLVEGFKGFINVQGQARSVTSQCSNISKGIATVTHPIILPGGLMQYLET